MQEGDEEGGADNDHGMIDKEVDEESNYRPYRAHSTIGGYRSALMDMYEANKIQSTFPSTEVAEFISGYKRNLADEQEKGLRSCAEGKALLTFLIHRKICRMPYLLFCAGIWWLGLYLWLCYNNTQTYHDGQTCKRLRLSSLYF